MTSRQAASAAAPPASPAGSHRTELAYATLMRQRIVLLTLSALVLVVTLVADILIGPAFLSIIDVLSALFAPAAAERTVAVIVYEIRLPMTLMAMLVGASLGIAGASMQTILGNPLASPYTLGVSAAAGFGAALVILTGFKLPLLPMLTIPIAAFIAAGGASALVYGFARLRGMSPEVMVLAGIATLFLFQSLQSLLQYLASPEVLQEMVFWLFGSMLKANWTNLSITAGILALSLALLLPASWKLTALRLGDERAQSLGVNVERLRRKVFAIVALLTAGAVAFVGTIGFVGLVAPHLARMLVGEDQRLLMPAAGVVGALMMTGASILSKLISPGAVVPIGIVTAVIGVPFLFGLIVCGRRRFW